MSAASTTAALIKSPVEPTPQQVLARLTGQVVAASDVSGQPDTALPSQMVLAIPVGKAVGFLGHNRPQLSDTDLRFLKANPFAQADPAITVSLSDAAGNYTLRLDPGEYAVLRRILKARHPASRLPRVAVAEPPCHQGSCGTWDA